MKWLPMPTAPGWWFFIPELKDWDLAMPVSVRGVEDCRGVKWLEAGLSERKKITPDMGWWLGPFRVQPPEA